jgi:hypothetical protein
MEIDFNPSRVPQTEPSQTAARQNAAASASDDTSFQGTSGIQEKLKNLQATRPEAVERAKSLISDSQYPPNDVLDRIAILIAAHMQL